VFSLPYKKFHTEQIFVLVDMQLRNQFRVGQKNDFFKFKKRGFLNPGKSAENIF